MPETEAWNCFGQAAAFVPSTCWHRRQKGIDARPLAVSWLSSRSVYAGLSSHSKSQCSLHSLSSHSNLRCSLDLGKACPVKAIHGVHSSLV